MGLCPYAQVKNLLQTLETENDEAAMKSDAEYMRNELEKRGYFADLSVLDARAYGSIVPRVRAWWGGTHLKCPRLAKGRGTYELVVVECCYLLLNY